MELEPDGAPTPQSRTGDAAQAASNPAAAEMIEHLGALGVETVIDRYARQTPQCRHGLSGLCCRMCQWGPCRITEKSPRGVCGRTLELVAIANLLRAAAAGASAQLMHAREMAIALRAAGRDEIALDLASTRRLREVGAAMNVSQSWTPMPEVAELVSAAMLEDLGRLEEGMTRTLGFAPRERRALWERLGIIPRSAAYEIAEALHMTTMGGCSDWEAMLLQALRVSLAHIYTSLVPSCLLSDVLFGIPEPHVTEVNYGVLRPGHVNILVHGHSPIMLEKVLEAVQSAEIQTLAHKLGAEGIVVGGMCCTGHEVLGRHGVPTVTGAMGQELVLGTGAVDAVIVDMQCALPGMIDVAACFGTQIITTCNSNRIPGALHVPFDPEHPDTLADDAMLVARSAVEAFGRRDRSKIHIPAHTTHAMTGFTYDTAIRALGSTRRVVERLETGELRGIVALVGCTSPRDGYEAAHVAIARTLIAQGVLVLASGCASHALLNSGLCSVEAAELAAPSLRALCEDADVPPVISMGACADNTRIIQVFAALALKAEIPLPEMPFIFAGPELANEKTVPQMLGAIAHGITTVVGRPPQLPLAANGCGEDLAPAPPGAEVLVDFFQRSGLPELLGARLLVQPDPAEAAALILGELDAKCAALGWAEAAEEAINPVG
jgi:carbon-monoxide dehydrogenase catalytic subunit